MAEGHERNVHVFTTLPLPTHSRLRATAMLRRITLHECLRRLLVAAAKLEEEELMQMLETSAEQPHESQTQEASDDQPTRSI